MDDRAAKLALARKKLKEHQEKKVNLNVKDELYNTQMKSNHFISEAETASINNNYTSDNGTSNCPYSEPLICENNTTQILISDKLNLEKQIMMLEAKYSELEKAYNNERENNYLLKQEINTLKIEFRDNKEVSRQLNDINKKYELVVKEFQEEKSLLITEKANLLEQLEFTKSVLTSKETENSSLHSQLLNLQNLLDATQLQLQQLTSESVQLNIPTINKDVSEQNALFEKITTLEKQIKIMQKEKEQTKLHYEHYVAELNECIQSLSIKNQNLYNEMERLSCREASLIDQISEMEIRLQNILTSKVNVENLPTNKLQEEELEEYKKKYQKTQEMLVEMTAKYNDLHQCFVKNESKLKEILEARKDESNENISITKLNADIESDKIAAQRATEQNIKLKKDLQELEEAFVKMTKDKLELTEKLSAEKFLNRELTLKLAEIDEKAKDMQIKLKAKDDEMIRLQTYFRDMETKFIQTQTQEKDCQIKVETNDCLHDGDHDDVAHTQVCHEHSDHYLEKNKPMENDHLKPDPPNHDQLDNKQRYTNENNFLSNEDRTSQQKLMKGAAMMRLEKRFLEIMDEVADLSDEKQRLEHIILQLQNETDTICEYIALYQQQRSLLKKRDEERSAQIKIFQSECSRMKRQLEELSGILINLTKDESLQTYFKTKSHQHSIEYILNLLSELKSNCLVDPNRTDLELKDFYPCGCCSGQLIDV